MNFFKLLLSNLKYYRKEHFLLAIGLVLSTAILTSALIIGDSVNYSLNAIVEKQLGSTQQIVFTQERFMPSSFATTLSNEIKTDVAPILLLRGMASSDNTETRIPNVQVCGIDSRFWEIGNCDMPELTENEIIINSELASKLRIKVGDELLIRVEKVSFVTENAPFVPTDNNSSALRMMVKAIADENSFGEFNIQSSQITPFTVFFPLHKLSNLSFNGSFANLLLISENQKPVAEINQAIKNCWTTDVINLKFREIASQQKIELTSDKVFIEDTILSVLQNNNLQPEPVFTYLINFIEKDKKATPYSFVSALGNNNVYNLTNTEIIINQWLADDLGVKVNDSVRLQYFTLESFRKLEEKTSAFVVKEIIDINGFAADSLLMPAFEGLSGVDKCSDWEAGIPVDYSKIRDKDEAWWKQHRGTPKAFISYQKAVELWGMNFGNTTAIRFNKGVDTTKIKAILLKQLQPSNLGLNVIALKEKASWAASNAVDFAQLFLGLSFFLILAAFMLSVLLFSLLLAQRKKEIGIYRSMGIAPKRIHLIFFGEGMLNALLSSAIGVLAGILLSYMILLFLNSIWNDIVRTNSIQLFISPLSLTIGFLSNTILATIIIQLMIRNYFKKQVQELNKTTYSLLKCGKIWLLIALSSTILIVALMIVGFEKEMYQSSSLFMTIGFLVLVSLTAWLAVYLQKTQNRKTETISNFSLALRNLSFDFKRNITIIGILAIGIFIVISTGANRIDFNRNANDNTSGTGDYSLYIETNLTVNSDLSTTEGREKLGIESNAKDVTFLQLLKYTSDDASCLNLNRITRPSVLGVDVKILSARNSFSFVGANSEVSGWELLQQPMGKNCIPAVADQTVIVWGMGKAVGDSILYLNERGDSIYLVLVAGLESSVFQGNLLISKENFAKNFPSISGSKVILAECKDNQTNELQTDLEAAFRNYGATIQPTAQRLATFNSVTNTYLDIFLALGGIALLFGTLGIAILIFRSIHARKHQFAMMQAYGISQKNIQQISTIEFSIILFAGIGIGILSAALASLQSLITANADVPYLLLISLIALFIVNGYVWIYIGSKSSVKSKFINELRNE